MLATPEAWQTSHLPRFERGLCGDLLPEVDNDHDRDYGYNHVLHSAFRVPRSAFWRLLRLPCQKMTTSGTWSFDWITSWDLPGDLDLRGCADSHVFFQPELIRAWTETYRPLRRMEPRFLIARASADDEQETVHTPPCFAQGATQGRQSTVFLPLVLDRGGWKDAWLRVLEPVGHNEFDYHDPIVSPGGTWNAESGTRKVKENIMRSFWKTFQEEIGRKRGEFDVFCLPRVRESCIGDISELQVSGFRFQPVEKAPFINLCNHASYEAFLASRSSNLRQGLKRKQRRLAERGAVQFKVYGREETDLALNALTDFRKNHEIRWPRAYRAAGLFENLIKHALPAGLLHLSTIECAGRPASWHVGFVHNNRFYWYMPAYDNTYSQFSPGLLHINSLIEECYRIGVTTFDFLRGEERYKYEWTGDQVTLYSLQMANAAPAAKIKSTARAFLRSAANVLRG